MKQAATESRSGVSPDPLKTASSSAAPPAPVASSVAPLAGSPHPWLSGRVFALCLIAALAAAFPKVLLGLDTFYYRDFGFMCYPQAFYERQSLLRGELPLWNPFICCGLPYLAQWGAWYPSYFLNVLFPMPWSANFFQILHMFWGGCGMYWLIRQWGLGTLAAAFAGFAYVFNGVTLSCLEWISYTAFLAWCPWVLGTSMAAWRHGGRWIPLAALASAMQVLAGAPELTVLFWILAGVLWLREVFAGISPPAAGRLPDLNSQSRAGISPAPSSSPSACRMPNPNSPKGWGNSSLPFWRSLGRFGLVIVLAASITMVQMLPFFDLLAHSERDRSFGSATWAMPGWGWANLLVPLFHCYHPALSPWFQPDQHLVCSYYLGAGALGLALAGAWLMRRDVGGLMGGMALACWILAMGSNAFLFDWVRHLLPWIGIARYPVKLGLFPVLLVPILAAWAIERSFLTGNKGRARLVALLGAAMLLLMGGLLWFARRYPLPNDDWNATALNTLGRAAIGVALLGGVWSLGRARTLIVQAGLQLALCALLALDAFTHNPGIIPAVPAATMVPGVWGLSGKGPPPKLGEGRVMTSPGGERPHNVNISSPVLHFTSQRLAEVQSLNLLDAVPKVGGAMILHPAHFEQIEKYIYHTIGTRFGDGLLDFLSVAWSSSAENPLVWASRTNYLPLISAGQRPVFALDDRVFSAIMAADFDPRQLVYLDEASRPLVSVTNRTACTVLPLRSTAHKLEADVEAGEPSLVVLSQSFYHLWRASVDGRSVPLLRANLAFQALLVPPGKHHITLAYHDPYFRSGALVSIVSLIVCGLMFFGGRLGQARPAPPKTGSDACS